MTHTLVRFGDEAREGVMRGVETMADAVKATLGPRGRTVLIRRGYGKPRSAMMASPSPRPSNLPIRAEIVREAAAKTGELAGDGTTTTAVLAQAIAREGVKAVAAGFNPTDLRRGIEAGVALVIDDIKARARTVSGRADIAQVGTIAANGDRAIGEMVADAMERVGPEGAVTIEEAKGLETQLEIVEGLQFDRGYLSPYFVSSIAQRRLRPSRSTVPSARQEQIPMDATTEERHANIQLPYVKRSGGLPLRDALSRRASARGFAGRSLEAQTIADLLWAGFGVNRPDDGGRTAPSARNWREIDIYVALRDALYRYDPSLNRLDFVAPGDLRAATGVQDFVGEAPLNLVYVADYAKMEGPSEAERDVFAAADASFVAQNVYLFCASEGLATVVRALIDRPALAKAMRLGPHQHVVLAQSVGYPAP